MSLGKLEVERREICHSLAIPFFHSASNLLTASSCTDANTWEHKSPFIPIMGSVFLQRGTSDSLSQRPKRRRWKLWHNEAQERRVPWLG